ncbi:cellulose biosynthesis cyclic di-GMP-binding regulatory protein BcsB [Gellertiella hungarica]|uniref:Cyclic di-GMP-binding protein n=1 Tax=Gellertiella hungarica TaxID=1572859 RepID=A0A7W6NJV3_9HYPH|nr:cellulose biosynthesis cyclic di-GMP-binding regulatory protein BcsB [Gellertiella hungarica]MBB4064178.1 hypothetical protein [Gellertiella hungarica]
MADRSRTMKVVTLLLFASVSCAPAVALAGENRLAPPVADVEAASGGAPAVAPAPADRKGSLIPFEEPPSSMKLTGEDDSTLLTFSLPERLRLAGGVLELSYTNAVSVLPDTARVDVALNGQSVGQFPVRSPNGFTTIRIPLKGDQVKAGRNQVRLRVVQHHRVDCSLPATYELWTRLSAGESGFRTALPVRFAGAADLLAVGRNGKEQTEIRLVADPAGGVALVNQAMPVIQSLALAMNRRDVVVSVAGQPGTGPGIDLYVGEAGQQGQPEAARRVLSGAAPGLTVADAEGSGRAAVVLRGASPRELQAGLLAALRGPLNEALQTGILAPRPGGIKGGPGSRHTLADAGYEAQPFAGRLSRARFTIDMPADFYPAEYDTMKFFLSGATAPGLLPNAQFLVRVNDRIVTSLPFRNTDGEVFRHKPIEMPLRAFRPGTNRVELLAEVPAPSDEACRPGEREDDKPRFMMLKESALEVPSLARIGRLPDLGAFAGTGYPYGRGKPFSVMIDRPGEETLSVAATTVTRLALAAGKPVEAILAFGGVDAAAKGDVLAISTDAASKVHAAAVEPGEAAGVPEAATAPAIDGVTTSATGHGDAIVSAGSEALLDAFRQSTSTGGERSMNARLQEWLGQLSNRFNSWLRYQDAPEGPMPEEKDTLVSISQTPLAGGEGVLTAIRAKSPDDLARGFDALSDPQAWERLEGARAILRAGDLALVTHQADQRFIREITDESFGNFRRLAASWFSDNFQIYIGLVIALFVGFGLWLGHVIPRKGVRSE